MLCWPVAGEGTHDRVSSVTTSGTEGAEFERTRFNLSTVREAEKGWARERGVARGEILLADEGGGAFRSKSPSMNSKSSSLSLGVLLISLVKLRVGLRVT